MTHPQDDVEGIIVTHSVVSNRSEIGMNIHLADYIDTLPASQHKAYPWRRTKITPCACIAFCVQCKQYLPIVDFYPVRNRSGRSDILGGRRVSHCKNCAMEKFYVLDHRQKLLNAAKNHAKEKGLPCTITIDDIVIPTHCPVLGMPLIPKVRKGRQNRHQIADSPTIDRVDNTKGYIPGNVCVISGRANHLKSNATVKEVEAILRYIKEHQALSETDATTAAAEVMR